MTEALWCSCKGNYFHTRTNDVAKQACADAGLTWHSGMFGGCDVGDNDTYYQNYYAKCKAINPEYTISSC
ncbi:hypothetical protein FBU30_002093, partial [Linnemannia zychae]